MMSNTWPEDGALGLDDCVNNATNERGDCGGRMVLKNDGTVLCETCYNRGGSDWDAQLRRWAVDDAVNVLREEQPEHFAHNVANVGDATPGGLGMLAVWLDRWMDDPVLDEAKPSPRDRSVYCAAYTKALRAGIEACELGCEGDYDPDDVTEAAVEAAEGTL